MTRVIGVDIGGTFTDVALFDGGRITELKVPTTADPADGVADSLAWDRADVFLHGTTAATNALLEERGARVALVTGEGYEDLIEIARQDRPSLYDSSSERPPPLASRDSRVGHRGDDGETIELVAAADPEMVVVGLVDGYLDPESEARLASVIGQGLDIPVVAATSVSPEFREYERIATALLSAYLTPSVAGYLDALRARLRVWRSLVLTSAGGLIPFEQGSANAARLVLSGPAGGVVAAAAVGAHHGHPSVISFDMGGTSTDVCRITGGVAPAGPGHQVAGRINRVPSVPVRTIGAGGGSVGWVDSGGALRVGPQSAGANPGPACYGQGGTQATVTDANLLVGAIPADLALAGSLGLDVSLAVSAMAELAGQARLTSEECARGMVEVVDSHMTHALRAVSVEEGADPRQSVLVAFGGAGGLHAGRLARELGIPRVLVPPLSGVFSALGLLLASPRADHARTVMLPQGDGRLRRLASEVVEAAKARYIATFDTESESTSLLLDCRYRGQSHELEIEASPDWSAVVVAFEKAHATSFGFTRPGEPVEVVNMRAVADGSPPLTWDQVIPALPTNAPEERGGVWRRGQLPAGFSVTGPTVVIEDNAAVLVEAGEQLSVLEDGTLELTRA